MKASRMDPVAIVKHAYWIPIRLTSVGYARVEAYCPEDATAMVEAGEFNPEEGIALEVEAHEVTGPPQLEEVH